MGPKASFLQGETPHVHIPTLGLLRGALIKDSRSGEPQCFRFGGVPYALPPIESRRWQKPHPLPTGFSYGTIEHAGAFDSTMAATCAQPASTISIPSAGVENCLQCNIYIPQGDSPKNGWPVLFYIHGGFLQFGSPSKENPSAMLCKTNVECIVVAPGYRLNAFGFLYSQELIDDSTEYGGGNFGFWDQRTALEWTFQNIEWFGGDKHNITVAGLSAGSYSTFHQMAHELLKPGSDIQTIRRVALWSNGCGTKPKSLPEAQSQFDELLKVLDIPLDATSGEKLARLRKVSTQGIIDAIDLMEQRAFKPASDNDFIQDGLWQELFAGTLGSKMRALGMKIMIGEVSKEENGYKFYDTPTSYPSLIRRLCREYSKELVLAICKEYRPKNSIMEPSATQWREIYGDLFSGVQVRASSRGLIDCLVKGGLPPSSIIRYRIDWRISALARTTPPDLGPTHASDLAIWFFGNGLELTEHETKVIKAWLHPYSAFLRGDKMEWGTNTISEMRSLSSDGSIFIQNDKDWQRYMNLWHKIVKATPLVHGLPVRPRL